MNIDEVDDLQESRVIDQKMAATVEQLKEIPENMRAILWVYDENSDEATMAFVNYRRNHDIIKDADVLPTAARRMKK